MFVQKRFQNVEFIEYHTVILGRIYIYIYIYIFLQSNTTLY